MIEPIARIRIELQGIEPRIWRRVDVPLTATLQSLHDVIQALMRWEYAHLFEFHVGNRIYGQPDPEMESFGHKVYQARNIRLGQLIDRGVDRFLYIYDFGDNWQHDVIVEEVRSGDKFIAYPSFVDGARRAPPEDVGGVSGFEEFLEAIANPNHEEHEHMLGWCGGAFDPDNIDEREIRRSLAVLAEFRSRARKRR